MVIEKLWDQQWHDLFNKVSHLVQVERIVPIKSYNHQLAVWLKSNLQKFRSQTMDANRSKVFAKLNEEYSSLSKGLIWSDNYYEMVDSFMMYHGHLPSKSLPMESQALKWVKKQIKRLNNGELGAQEQEKIHTLINKVEFRTYDEAMGHFNKGKLPFKYAGRIISITEPEQKKPRSLLTDELICELAKQSTCGKDMRTKSVKAYRTLKSKPQLWEASTAHWVKVKRKCDWSEEELTERAKKYKNRHEMILHDPAAFEVLKSRGLIKKCAPHWRHFRSSSLMSLSDKELCEIAQKYSRISDMKKKDNKVLSELRRRGEEVYQSATNHLEEAIHKNNLYWTNERLWSVVRTVRSLYEMRKTHRNAYFSLLRNKDLEAECVQWWATLWTDSAVMDFAKQVDSKDQFRRRFPEAFFVLGLRPELNKKCHDYWENKYPLERITELASQCNSRSEFKHSYPVAYRKVCEDEEFFKQFNGQWRGPMIISDEELFQAIIKFDSPGQVRKASKKYYNLLLKNRIVYGRVKSYWLERDYKRKWYPQN